MKFHLISLGCPKNTVDSELISGNLVRNGAAWVPSPDGADLVLLNTCGFIKEAKEESLRHIFQLLALKRTRPRAKIVVFGCMVKRYREELSKEIPEIDGLFEFLSEAQIPEILGLARSGPRPKKVSGASNRPFSTATDSLGRFFLPPHIGFLKIAEGCVNRCSYCAIPDIRGPFRSIPMDDLLRRAKKLAKAGVKEISVIAQDTLLYGAEKGGRSRLPELLEKLAQIPGPEWIRLHYLHPKRLSEELIDGIFSIPKVVPYFDIPFQHVSDRMLALMNRSVTKKELIHLMGAIRKRFRGGIIRSTFIVGFPGETENEFQELMDFIQLHPVDRLGAFPFSAEEGTPAWRITPKVPSKEKIRRLDELMTLQQVVAADRNRRMESRLVTAIVDRISGETAFGRYFGDAFEVDNLISFGYDGSFEEGQFLTCRILSAEAYDFTGEVVSRSGRRKK